ncbi:MAG: hypothetical protein ACIARR_09970 [Phycisphaerales bacterium JB059]
MTHIHTQRRPLGETRRHPDTGVSGEEDARRYTTGAAGDPEARRVKTERVREDVEKISPEGRPAHPETGSGGVLGFLIGSVIVVAMLAVATGIFAGVAAGLVVLVFGLGLAVLINPVVWTSMFRAEELREAERHEEQVEATRRR